MKKEDVISAGVMTIVSMLVLIGFTVAWYSGVFDIATIGGMHLKAAEMNTIKIALTEDGPDISTLDGEDQFVDIGLQEMTNVETDKLAPGQFGKVTFYVTPSDSGIEYCDIFPRVWISQSQINETNSIYQWYPGEEKDVWEPGDQLDELVRLYEITQRHILFFEDEDMQIPIANAKRVTWTEADGNSEKAITVYWKWHYEYPFSAEELDLSAEEQQKLIDNYDAEDTQIGNNITAMKFHFDFSAQ